MQIFANGKQHFYFFMELYVIHLKNQWVKNLITVPPYTWKGETYLSIISIQGLSRKGPLAILGQKTTKFVKNTPNFAYKFA